MKKLILWLFLIFSTLTYPMWLTEYERDNKWNEKTGRTYIYSYFYGYDCYGVSSGVIGVEKNYYIDAPKIYYEIYIKLNEYYFSENITFKKRNDTIKTELKIDSNEPVSVKAKFQSLTNTENNTKVLLISIFSFENSNIEKLFEQMKKGKQLKVLINDKYLRTCNLDNFTKSFNELNPGKY